MPPTPPIPGAPFYVRMNNSAVAAYDAALASREVLGHQLNGLGAERDHLAETIRHGGEPVGARAATEARLASIDARIAALDKQIALADQRIVESAAVPGAVSGHQSEQRWVNRHDRGSSSEALIAIPIVFFIFVLSPLSIAYARRVWRRGTAVAIAPPNDLSERMARLDQAVESIAIEVERIGEGQRFMTRVLTESDARTPAIPPVR